MNLVSDPRLLKIFYGAAACSWMPHWACHYYRLETGSDFVVGSWAFSIVDSVGALFGYSLLVALNLAAIQSVRCRITAAAITGTGHLILGSLHAYRLMHPFTFKIFGYSWSNGASLREILIVVPFGLISLLVAIGLATRRKHV